MRTLLSILILLLFTNFNQAQTTAIPDANFEQELIDIGVDNTIDGSVLTANIDTMTHLVIGSTVISNLTGIEDFSSLTDLTCIATQITAIDLSQNTNLKRLNIFSNQFISLDLSQNIQLESLSCSNNQLTHLILPQSLTLEQVVCRGNQLTNLDVSQNTSLIDLDCSYNQLTHLDITQNINLTSLEINFNQIPYLDLSQNIALNQLNCNSNQLIGLNLSQNINLTELNCMDNNLNCLNIKNGNNIGLHIRTMFNPDLTCIEVDDTAQATLNWIPLTNIDAHTSFSNSCSTPCLVSVVEKNQKNISIYPNPTLDKLNIDLQETLANPIIIITNNLGQVVLTKTYESTNFINIDFDVPEGIYFLQIQSEAREFITKKIVKE